MKILDKMRCHYIYATLLLICACCGMSGISGWLSWFVCREKYIVEGEKTTSVKNKCWPNIVGSVITILLCILGIYVLYSGIRDKEGKYCRNI
jgi:uncharacterized sodium:solute symporter family permease YidK